MTKITMEHDNIPNYLRIDERTHVEKSLLNLLVDKVRVTPLLTESQEGGA